ncbi:MAG TPA: 4Fe-4S single cluster domain-containing protein [Mycobacteriales bacterium]|nr:4Fe-4S single cluster domain-containing protein [Mycobacteriales bacterium]
MSRLHYPVTALGPGRRLGVWVQGCALACPGCLSRDTWDPAAGRTVPVAELLQAWRAAVADGADGLTVSGGEPLDQAEEVAELLAGARAVRAPADRDTGREIDILLYTGYELSELDDARSRVVDLADAVITGRYVAGQPTGLIWRGSANQRLLPRTPLGAARYGRYLDHVPDRTPMQVSVDAHNIWFVGVPRRGDMPRLERALARRGVHPGKPSWRP